jgi:hypothetical protein
LCTDFERLIACLKATADWANESSSRFALSRHGCTAKPGLVQAPRWLSLFEFVSFLERNFEAVRAAAEPERLSWISGVSGVSRTLQH